MSSRSSSIIDVSSSDEEIIVIRRKNKLKNLRIERKNSSNEESLASDEHDDNSDCKNDKISSSLSETSSDEKYSRESKSINHVLGEEITKKRSTFDSTKQFGYIDSSSEEENDDIDDEKSNSVAISDITDDSRIDQSNKSSSLKIWRKDQLESNDESWHDAIETQIILEQNDSSNPISIKVDPGLAPILKPHQIDGLKFMFNVIMKSLDSSGNPQKSKQIEPHGCILAHSMGLGKTLQIVTLLHTLMTNDLVKKHLRKALIIVPYNVARNWYDEFIKWFKKCNQKSNNILIWTIYDVKRIAERRTIIRDWKHYGGVMIITSKMATNMILKNENEKTYKLIKSPDLVVIDEGHLLKNDQTSFYRAIKAIDCPRRIILTGTPLQNNLSEYFFMIDIIKPKLLGTKERFYNRFEKPINDGQMIDSTNFQLKLMKKRIHVLNRMLKNYVHRCDYQILVPYLPPKFEFVIGVRLTKLQSILYRYYLNNLTAKNHQNLLRDSLLLMLLGNHPKLLIDHYRNKCESNDEFEHHDWWWKNVLDQEQQQNIDKLENSAKLILLFSILNQCEQIGDKILIYSQSIPTLDLIEKSLNEQGWTKGSDYLRIDGTTNIEDRHTVIEQFNDTDNKRTRLMLISIRAGGIGINLIGANRCILYDCSWNPAIDSQAIFRVFRLGQKKPVYIYRLISFGTMEWKIYQRQVQKQSLSRRVVDEQHVIRNYTKSQLTELYTYVECDSDDNHLFELPKDDLLADLLLTHFKLIQSYHEHDSLLEQRPEEELNESEKLEAWTEYLQDKMPEQRLMKKTSPLKTKSDTITTIDSSSSSIDIKYSSLTGNDDSIIIDSSSSSIDSSDIIDLN